jgi:hypothetical protein
MLSKVRQTSVEEVRVVTPMRVSRVRDDRRYPSKAWSLSNLANIVGVALLNNSVTGLLQDGPDGLFISASEEIF